MPVQTTKKSNVYFPDGALVAVKEVETDPWFDLGAINSAVNNTLEYDVNDVESANAGKLDRQIRNMRMSGGFTLINLDPEGVEKLGGGIFTRETTSAGSQTPEDQVISSAQFSTTYYLELKDSSGNNLKPTTDPVITSVTASVAGALTKDDDYVQFVDSDSPSGYSIMFRSGGIAGMGAGEDVTVDYGANDIQGSQTLYMGSSTLILDAYAMRITHTDSAGKIRQLELFSVDPESGGFQFNFKGANEDGVEEMPLTYTAKLDTELVDGRQLAAWTIEDGAQ